MVVNKVVLATVAADFLFLASGGVVLGFTMIVRNTKDDTPTEGEQAARNLIYQRFPLQAGLINAIMIFITFLATIPGLVRPNRMPLKVAGYGVMVCGITSLWLGVYLWVLTLRTKSDFFDIWTAQDPSVQSLMETTFNCCGYLDSKTPAFVTNTVCTSPAAAALMRGCSVPINSFSNVFIDDIFTAMFGMVGADALLILSIACLLKERKERERFRMIDKKAGYSGI